MKRDLSNTALLVVDVQAGFDDPAWGPRNNPDFEQNIAALMAVWKREGRPIVVVRHDSITPDSPLRPGQPGNDLRPEAAGEGDVLIAKSVNSAFYGDPDLHGWLLGKGITSVAVTGIQTNMCCETTARMAGNLGYETLFVLDATATFDLPAHGGGTISADELARVTASNLQDEFADVVMTADLI
ncbi:MAG: cysteine hydrolase [Acidimicrobiia bacterium]|nr:cysteine hydrolase [Acidimicrobiia bacterium]